MADKERRAADAAPSSAGGSGAAGVRAARQARAGSQQGRTKSVGNVVVASAGSGSGSGSGSARGPLKFKTNFRNTIYDTLLRRGWKETNDNDWDFYWADREFVYELLDTTHLESGQRVNHYRNGREDLLIKNLKRMKRQVEKKAKANDDTNANEIDPALGAYDFFPVTFILPGEYGMFVDEFKRNQGVWIMKPIGKAQGKGIFLFTKLSQISDWRSDVRGRPDGQGPQVETYVVQKYLATPYLVGGKKFDLRLYALVPTFSAPVEIYLFRGGFARFTNSRYSTDASDIANSFIHLTNVAIQKTSENYNQKHGGKWDLRRLKLYMMSRHGTARINQLFYEIQSVIIKSVLSIEKVIMSDKHCFELYGFDVMIDQALKPWLLEVNASPSLSANTASDYQLKCGMLNDMLDILDLESKRSGVGEERIGGFDLVYRDGLVRKGEAGNSTYTTFLGAEISRPNTARSPATTAS